MVSLDCRSEIGVEYVQHMGSDDMFCHAAWVSSYGQRKREDATEERKHGVRRTLITKRHGVPFEHAAVTLRIHCPIKVLREWHRHRVGWSYSEESGRFKELEPVFYVPPPDRPLVEAPDFKPMSPEFVPADPRTYSLIVESMKRGYREAWDEYQYMLSLKCDKGLSRDVLGVGIYSSMYCTANPRSLMHFLELRTFDAAAKRPSKPLWEMAKAARQVEEIVTALWPKAMALWNENGRMAP